MIDEKHHLEGFHESLSRIYLLHRAPDPKAEYHYPFAIKMIKAKVFNQLFWLLCCRYFICCNYTFTVFLYQMPHTSSHRITTLQSTNNLFT